MKKQLLLILYFTLTSIVTAFAERYYVKPNATGNGSSWENAINLQKALSKADATEIWVAEGTYYPGTTRDASFVVSEGVHIYGGFTNTEIVDNRKTTLSDFTRNRNKTILSGEIGTASKTDNSYHVVILKESSKIDGFTITDGYSDDSEGVFEFENLVNRGAGIYFKGTPEKLITISNNIISNNTIYSGIKAYAFGAGVFGLGTANITNNIINNNTVNAISNTQTSSSFASGGGIYVSGSTNIVGNLVHGNTCKSYSIYNDAISTGGGITAFGNSFIINNTIVKNDLLGGEAFKDASGVNLPDEGAIYNSIIWGNNGGRNMNSNINARISHSLIEGLNDIANGNIDASTTTTASIFADYNNNKFHLKSNSPTVNVGNDSLYGKTLPIDKDIEGNPRLSGTNIDLGAYEYQANISSIEDIENNIKIFPTLTTGKVYIETVNSDSVIELYSITGKLLQKTQTNEVDLSVYPKGIYILYIEGKTTKVVKQ